MPKIIARRLEKVQRDFLWGGENLEGKIHLVNWEVVCTDKEKGGLGLRKLAMLNKAFLSKWIWRYTCDKDNLWKQVITVKYGQRVLDGGQRRLIGAIGVGGTKIGFWTNVWCTDTTLSHCFLHLFVMAIQRSSTVEGMWDQILVKEAFFGGRLNYLEARKKWVPTKVVFFAWEATWGNVLTLDRLQRRGVQLSNCCFLRECEEENVNHILIHCIVVRALWDIVLGLVDVKRVFPETVKEVLITWRGSFVGKKKKKVWESIPFVYFLDGMEGEE
ncbi:putative ribonuclease H protein [Vitis vinifera]|uniref:Putative ribonuclease H protein n=1 Tax=Vitis vinifera TaxID=29760 RepID=A0A438GWX1_VITVI|nr:putative ribonuclease H protein [Vitis vinifera]